MIERTIIGNGIGKGDALPWRQSTNPICVKHNSWLTLWNAINGPYSEPRTNYPTINGAEEKYTDKTDPKIKQQLAMFNIKDRAYTSYILY